MTKMKKKICKNCQKQFETSRPLQIVCGSRCASEWSYKLKEKRQEADKKEKNKVDKLKLKEMALYIKSRSDYVRELQALVNKIARLIDSGNPCISSGKLTGKINGGHFFPTSTDPKIRFNLFNIFLQSEYANTYKHGDHSNYSKNLQKIFGDEIYLYVLDLPIIYKDLQIGIEDIKPAIIKAKNIIKTLESCIHECPRTTEQRINLRRIYNNEIGIYN